MLVAMPFAVLLARDLCNGRRRAWAWVLPLLACGDVAATYLAAVRAERLRLKAELAELEIKMDGYLKELGY